MKNIKEKIKMINCPICGNPICCSIGFNCYYECEYNKTLSCLQIKNYSCFCSKFLIRKHLMKGYNLDDSLTTKEMVVKVSHILNDNFISPLSNKYFDLQI